MRDETKKFKAWITKYALTQGIYEIGAVVCDTDESGDMIEEIKLAAATSNYYHGKGRDWHETKESAIACAEEMRKKKIAAMKKQIVKLEQMKFE
jgi:hypothetical protein